MYVWGARADYCRGGDSYGIDYTCDSMYSYMRVVQGTRRTTMRELWAAIAHAEGWGARSEAEYVLYNSPMEHTRTVSAIMADATPDSDDDENFTW